MTFGAIEIPAVLGALGSAGGLAGLAGGGGSAPLMQIDTISEQGTCCNFVCCSPNASLNIENKKVTYNGSSFEPEKKPSCISKIFKKICCCCGEKEPSKKEKIEDFYANYQYWLVQNHGAMAAFAAPQYAGVDWNTKVNNQQLLTVGEVRMINQKAVMISRYEPQIRQWMRHLNYYGTVQQMESSDEEGSMGEYSRTETLELHKTVKHPDGTKEKFKAKKLKHSIRKAPTTKKVRKSDADRIALSISSRFAADAKSIASIDLVKASAREIAKNGYQFKDPAFATKLPKSSLGEEICGKQDVSELTAEECCTLIKLAKKEKKRAKKRDSISSSEETPKSKRSRRAKRKKIPVKKSKKLDLRKSEGVVHTKKVRRKGKEKVGAS